MKLFDLDKLIDTLTSYIENRVELLKLDFREQIAAAVAKAFNVLLQVVVGLMVVTFIFIGVAFLLNDLLKSTYLGFLIVGALFAIVFWRVWAARERISARVLKSMQEDVPQADTEKID